MNNKNITKLALLMPLAAIATACSTMTVNDAEEQIEKTDKSTEIKLRQGSAIVGNPSSVTMVKSSYIAGKSFKKSDRDFLPDFFKASKAFNQPQPVSFNEIISNIGEEINARVELTPDAINHLMKLSSSSGAGQSSSGADVEKNVNEILDYSGRGLIGSDVKYSLYHVGTVESLLDVITARANLFWKWDRNKVSIFRMETKNYTFDGEATTSTFSAKIESSQQSSEESGGGSASSHGTTFNTDTGSAFDDLSNAINSMKSDDGRFNISKQTGTVTLTDTPAVQAKVEAYLEDINAIVNKRILIKAEVYEVVSDEQGKFGIDWDMVYDGSSRYGVDLASNFTEGDIKNLTLGLLPGNGVFSGTQAFVHALNEENDTSLVTTSTNYTTNGQPVPVQIINEKHYIKSVTTESDTSGSDDSSTRYEIEPGTILSGFTMTVNPRVDSEGDIAMQFAVDMSQLNALVERQFGEDDSQFMIQLPDKTSKNFIQRVSVRSGSTVMISGFERTLNESSTSSIGAKETWMAGGSREGGKTRVMTVILVTPYLMSK